MNTTNDKTKPRRPRRTKNLLVRLAPEERDAIAAAAERARLPMATYVRSLLLRAVAKAGGKRDASGG